MQTNKHGARHACVKRNARSNMPRLCQAEGISKVNRSVFYFDDDETLLENFAEMFGDEYEVRTAATLTEAMRILREFKPEIIISDQLMPEIEGTAFLGEAMPLCPDSFRILLTGWMVVGEVLPELGAGIIHLFLPKPWMEDQMRAALKRASLHYDLRRAR